MSETQNPRRIGRSILAMVAGFGAGALLSLGTDLVLYAAGIYPPLNQPRMFSTGLLVLATLYRTVYGVLSGYIAARLAPDRPMAHAVALGFVGLLVGVAGFTLMRNAGPIWYPLALVVLSVPQCWGGGKINELTAR